MLSKTFAAAEYSPFYVVYGNMPLSKFANGWAVTAGTDVGEGECFMQAVHFSQNQDFGQPTVERTSGRNIPVIRYVGYIEHPDGIVELTAPTATHDYFFVVKFMSRVRSKADASCYGRIFTWDDTPLPNLWSYGRYNGHDEAIYLMELDDVVGMQTSLGKELRITCKMGENLPYLDGELLREGITFDSQAMEDFHLNPAEYEVFKLLKMLWLERKNEQIPQQLRARIREGIYHAEKRYRTSTVLYLIADYVREMNKGT